ncbi:hypothetical protein, partial [Frankia sp. AvcI1]
MIHCPTPVAIIRRR